MKWNVLIRQWLDHAFSCTRVYKQSDQMAWFLPAIFSFILLSETRSTVHVTFLFLLSSLLSLYSTSSSSGKKKKGTQLTGGHGMTLPPFSH